MREHSETLNELAKALSAAQGEFTAIPKGDTNPFFQSKYAALPSVIETASPVLSRYGLSVAQFIGSDDKGDTLTTWLMHSSGQFIADTMRLRPMKNDPQSQGSATTYARRYSYMSVLGLVADVDDDGNAGANASRPRQQNRPAQNRPQSKPTARTPEPNPVAAAVQADPETGEKLVNLTSHMLSEIKGADRPKFIQHLEATKGFQIAKVPDSEVAAVETMIEEFAAGRPFEASS